MRTSSWKPAVVSMSVAACILGVTERDAAACSPSGCTAGRAFPASGTTVPANLPAVGFWGLYSGATTLLELRDGHGALVPTVIGGDGAMTLLLLSSPLVEGESYTLRYDDDCKPSTPHEHVFVAGAASTIPSAFGTLTLASHRVESIRVRHSGSCFADRIAAAATFDLAISPEMVPFVPSARLETRVDGELWNKSDPGVLVGWVGGEIPPGIASIGTDGAYRWLNRVHTLCDGSGWEDPGVKEGKHTLTMGVSIPGFAGQIAVSHDFELWCDQGSDAGLDADTDASGADAAPAAQDSEQGGPRAEGGGCSLARATHSHGLLTIALLSLARARMGRRKGLGLRSNRP